MTRRTILITGCSSGIGAAAARILHSEGWRVFATARKDADLARLKDEGLEAFYLDYTRPDSIEALAGEVLARCDGRLDALFNNGAYGQPGAVEDVPVAALRAQMEANFFGWHDLTCRIIPAMRAAGGGRIVQCSSVLGLVAMRYRGAYVASKFALEGLTDVMRQELRGSGIHVVSIEPGPIATRFTEHSKRAFVANIDLENSAHSDYYAFRLKQFDEGGDTRFELPPEAVVAKLKKALESPSPKPHYYVTFPTHLMAFLRRILPTRLFDAFLVRVV
ncbi:NAD(P)-dependent dehydrogenase (short-subunit alcohol dehydrogenase family) [Rhodobium orientis]|uniref:Short-chain dehydrogenase n=1 Tax=Rhodobium orientis TaxID=34017 RepID=A0A327JTM1_9HYPH|nr:SDR family oxidoreductase [Rhodobium orientis]MBB4304353.1 NAD(P)-dependent dehydrogenase (short-subunit alcohol dehydrogenase family) [Rhodobium orientis]MBK5948153.1 short-chain dehydrogenase [Rhodobium orientis]RAI28846.1 short-chain dehydrogenase [Rhodobium orientis]